VSWFRPWADLRIRIARPIWDDLIAELAKRGRGTRESGAFLLGSRDRRVVSLVVYYDDLDPDCLTGGISLDGRCYGRLWQQCRDARVRVLADIHTHPGASVGQSTTDREYPMVATGGHVGLIVPRFAQGEPQARDVGFHVYLGEDGWRSWFGRAAARRLRITR
jgi:proteasome lid subunit RPN8/RPN11